MLFKEPHVVASYQGLTCATSSTGWLVVKAAKMFLS